MSKYVILSFDDGREDTYKNAYFILKKYGLMCTVNITTDFIENPSKYNKFASAANKSMKIENIKEMLKDGFEIANHSAHHINTADDVKIANNSLMEWGIDISEVGFASPFSYLTKDNGQDIYALLENKQLSYIRSGIQVRRQSVWYKILYIIHRFIRLNDLFYLLNRKQIIRMPVDNRFVSGISITKDTTVEELKKFIRRMPDKTAIILIFHSVLEKTHEGYGVDKWFWDKDKFEEFCVYLKNNPGVETIRTIDLFRKDKAKANKEN